jgi:hypothetical protein
MIVFTEVDQTTAENKFWYRFRPQETINELNDVMKVVRKDLEGCTTSYWHLLKGISPCMIRWPVPAVRFDLQRTKNKYRSEY